MSKKKRLLLVEDEIDLIKLYKKILTEAGYDLTICNDGVSAYKAIKNDVFDLYLIDIVMPSLDGVALLKKINEEKNESIAKKTIILFTNFDNETAFETAKKYGATDVLIKVNFNPEELLQKIKKYLDT